MSTMVMDIYKAWSAEINTKQVHIVSFVDVTGFIDVIISGNFLHR